MKLEAEAVAVTIAEADQHPGAVASGYVRLVVEDDGSGIPPEIRAKTC